MDGRLKIDQGMEMSASLKGREESAPILLPDNFGSFRRDKGKKGQQLPGVFAGQAVDLYIAEIQDGYGAEMVKDIYPADQRFRGYPQVDVLNLGLGCYGNKFDHLDFAGVFRLKFFIGGTNMKISL
jgi:hypothetical protein